MNVDKYCTILRETVSIAGINSNQLKTSFINRMDPSVLNGFENGVSKGTNYSAGDDSSDSGFSYSIGRISWPPCSQNASLRIKSLTFPRNHGPSLEFVRQISQS